MVEEKDKGAQRVNKIPKSVRQVGEVADYRHIYMEDYVLTYTRKLADESEDGIAACALLGHMMLKDKKKYIFISGAVKLTHMSFNSQQTFSDETWTQVYQSVKEFFDNVEIVGWCFSQAGLGLVPKQQVLKLHEDNFAGEDNVLFLMDTLEHEEDFYVYRQGQLIRSKGYYIYYEKNPQMQEYMLSQESNQPKIEEIEDRAVFEMRELFKEKNKHYSSKKIANFVYGVGTIVAIATLVVGGATLYNLKILTSGNETPKDLVTNVTHVETMESGVKETLNPTTIPTPVATPSVTPVITPIPKSTPTPVPTPAPTPKPTVKPTAKPASVENKNYIFYTVKQGDTLTQIAERLYNNIGYASKIRQLNDMGNKDKIVEGQKLKVPKV